MDIEVALLEVYFLLLQVTFGLGVRAELTLEFRGTGLFRAIRSTSGGFLAQETSREQRHLLLPKGLYSFSLYFMRFKEVSYT